MYQYRAICRAHMQVGEWLKPHANIAAFQLDQAVMELRQSTLDVLKLSDGSEAGQDVNIMTISERGAYGRFEMYNLQASPKGIWKGYTQWC